MDYWFDIALPALLPTVILPVLIAWLLLDFWLKEHRKHLFKDKARHKHF